MGFRLFFNICCFFECRSHRSLFLFIRSEIVPSLPLFPVLKQVQEEVQSVLTFSEQKVTILMYLVGIGLVDAWSRVFWISSKADSKRFQEAAHPCAQTLRPVETERFGSRHGDIAQIMLRCGFLGPYLFAKACLEGTPSNTMTLSARSFTIDESCSTTNAVFFAWRMNLQKQNSSWRNREESERGQMFSGGRN